ncbi:LrgB family protein [Halioxenophilus aromaticivorans]|uniref:LrgB family protein n=1 Tax=Halioxenophilus aromaticivorans TaxID=1306992 RepID=A0AAV3U637_9ALTE
MTASFLNELTNAPVVSVLLTVATFQLGLMAYKASNNNVIFHPVLIGASVTALIITLVPLEFDDYFANNAVVMFFLGPLIVALAVPLRAEIRALKGIALPALLVVVLGSFIAPAAALGVAWLMGAEQAVLEALLPKSVTSPIALGLAHSIGSMVVLTTAISVITGVIGAILAPPIFKLVGLTDDRLQGLCLGINAHGLGTVRAFEVSVRCGALAGLGMGLTGAFSAFLIPYVHLWAF